MLHLSVSRSSFRTLLTGKPGTVRSVFHGEHGGDDWALGARRLLDLCRDLCRRCFHFSGGENSSLSATAAAAASFFVFVFVDACVESVFQHGGHG